ncbi:MAG: efflux transporter periplasmic adaptor subunit [Desulfobulbus propionicus]|nr:MAG: efflux transporter periplasmic adaptor subunit [Desulfobulbus propionicus]
MKTLTLILLFTLFLFLENLNAEAPAPVSRLPAVKVRVVEIRKEAAPSLVETTGTIQARQRATIAAKVTGVITELPVVLGSRVAKGDLLVRISAKEIQAQLSQAQAQLTKAERDLAREKKLLKKKASTTETVKSMEDRHAVAQAAFQEARTMLGYTTITAPFAGVVTNKQAQPGDLATPGMPLLTLKNDHDLQAVSAVPEAMIPLVHLGDHLQVRVPAANLNLTGKVAEIAPAADPASRTAPVKLDLDFTPGLRPGQFARMILPGLPRDSLFVPNAAIRKRGQLNRVFVERDHQAHLRLVRTGTSDDQRTEILSGLEAGDRVIVSGNRQLVNGQPLDVQP